MKPALFIIDLWERHYCSTLTERIASLVPSINRATEAVRQAGGVVVWVSSDGPPQNDQLRPAPWANFVGCLCEVPEPAVVLPRVQHPDLIVRSDDYTIDNDSLSAALELLHQEKVDVVAYAGVASNMCVLYRRTGVVNMQRHKRCVLLSDLSLGFYPYGAREQETSIHTYVAMNHCGVVRFSDFMQELAREH